MGCALEVQGIWEGGGGGRGWEDVVEEDRYSWALFVAREWGQLVSKEPG